MKPIIFNLPNEQYHRSADTASYISSSQLKDYAISPAYAKYMREHPELREETPNMRFGTQFHDFMEHIVLGETVDEAVEHYATFIPPINPTTGQYYGENTKKYQEGFLDFLEANRGKTIIPDANLKSIVKMAKSILSHHENAKLIAYAKPEPDTLKGPEISFFTELSPGVFAKCRADALTSKKCIDWKTTSGGLDPDSLSSTILKFKYDVSAAFYQLILYKVTGQFYPFFWFFVNNSEPFNATVPVSAENFAFGSEDDIIAYENDLDRTLVFNHGVMEMRALLDEHTWCINNNQWQGPEVFVEPTESNVRVLAPTCPAYASNRIPKFYHP